MPEPLDGSKMDRRQFLVCSFAAVGMAGVSKRPSYSLAPASAADGLRPDLPPVIPVGLDAYRMWDRWAYQRIGARACMTSTYDRSGGNEGADASHYLYQLSDTFNVTVDLEGSGVLYFARYNHWHGSPWHYQVDGTDYILEDSSTLDPTHPIENSAILPARLFPTPLAITWSTSRGSDLIWVPVPFERSFRMAYERTHYGTGYYIYHRYVGGAGLSQPIQSWNLDSVPGKDVLDLIAAAGSDLLATTKSIGASQQPIAQKMGEFVLPASGSVAFAEIEEAPSMVRALEISIPRENSIRFGRTRLRVTWDGRPEPSIDVPVALFFGAGTLYNRDGREYLVKAFPVHIRFDCRQVHLACYFPMPFFCKARFELVNESGTAIPGVQWSIRYAPYKDPANHAAYFHATYRDHPQPALGRDLELLDTCRVEGGGNWSGSFVGTSMIFSHRARLNTLEGDPRFFFDDSLTPQAQGTGTEEWGGGGDYWEKGHTTTLPFAGHPVGAPSPEEAKREEDLIHSEYRFLLADLMPFGKNARIQFEHGGTDNSNEHYETVAYWYGLPSPSLIKTDELRVGDLASEKAHEYDSPDASKPYPITSRYEWGVDQLDGKEIYPAYTEVGRTTAGTSEFTMKLSPENFGVMLRRTLDYSFPNQRAEVHVCDASENAKDPANWKPAGVWYLAGSNTCVYSNPKGELGATEHVIETSDRRLRDDEFLISRDLTQGLSAIRLRVRFTQVNIPLFPGAPPQKLAWSEIAYSAYCFVMPDFEI
jgi:D-arabinan exo alpha-(1,3)/(1,5)-arabinofuranosidase (non-reducing end)